MAQSTPPTVLTDQQTFLDLMRSFGLEPTIEVTPERHLDLERETIPGYTTVTLRAKEGGVQGYEGFCADFTFTDNGTFEEVHVWE